MLTDMQDALMLYLKYFYMVLYAEKEWNEKRKKDLPGSKSFEIVVLFKHYIKHIYYNICPN